jgi:hypothetical protein
MNAISSWLGWASSCLGRWRRLFLSLKQLFGYGIVMRVSIELVFGDEILPLLHLPPIVVRTQVMLTQHFHFLSSSKLWRMKTLRKFSAIVSKAFRLCPVKTDCQIPFPSHRSQRQHARQIRRLSNSHRPTGSGRPQATCPSIFQILKRYDKKTTIKKALWWSPRSISPFIPLLQSGSQSD